MWLCQFYHVWGILSLQKIVLYYEVLQQKSICYHDINIYLRRCFVFVMQTGSCCVYIYLVVTFEIAAKQEIICWYIVCKRRKYFLYIYLHNQICVKDLWENECYFPVVNRCVFLLCKVFPISPNVNTSSNVFPMFHWKWYVFYGNHHKFFSFFLLLTYMC
jgi:hypothetical protein